MPAPATSHCSKPALDRVNPTTILATLSPDSGGEGEGGGGRNCRLPPFAFSWFHSLLPPWTSPIPCAWTGQTSIYDPGHSKLLFTSRFSMKKRSWKLHSRREEGKEQRSYWWLFDKCTGAGGNTQTLPSSKPLHLPVVLVHHPGLWECDCCHS